MLENAQTNKPPKLGPLAIAYIVVLTIVYFALVFFVLKPKWVAYKAGLCASSCQVLYTGSIGQVKAKALVGTRTSSDESTCACQTGTGEVKAGYFLVSSSFFDWLLLNMLGLLIVGVSLFLFVLFLAKSLVLFFPKSK